MIVILDVGLANVGSVENMLKRIGVQVMVSSSTESILSATGIIIPGVGSFDAGVRAIKDLDCFSVLEEAVLNRKVPVLGICLGMQLMTASSDEGIEAGLGWVEAKTVRLHPECGVVPNMGWRYLNYMHNNVVSSEIEGKDKFYFVHSFSVLCENHKNIHALSEGDHNVVASYCYDNIMGVQFHPEKSHMYGFAFFRRWLTYYGLYTDSAES
jgi:glutamine amidotransferase